MTNGRINPANVPDIALRDGHSIPQVGLGVLRIDDEGLARTLGVCNLSLIHISEPTRPY